MDCSAGIPHYHLHACLQCEIAEKHNQDKLAEKYPNTVFEVWTLSSDDVNIMSFCCSFESHRENENSPILHQNERRPNLNP